MTLDVAVMRILRERDVDPRGVTRGDIADDVRQLTGKPDQPIDAIGNALTRARKNAPNNGGMRVRT
jgi:hypothetical protein